MSALAATAPVLATSGAARAQPAGPAPLATMLLASESDFYLAQRWCLNAFPSVRALERRLDTELARVTGASEAWQRGEAAINVLLMACAIADAIDDYLLGLRSDLSRAKALVPIPPRVAQLVDSALAAYWKARLWRWRALRRWQARWHLAVEAFAGAALVTPRPPRAGIGRVCERLRKLLREPLPDAVGARRPRIPGAFRRHDLSHHDAIALARRFAASCPDRRQPLLVLAVRTAGAYFAPLVAASLKQAGFGDVKRAAIHPVRGMSPEDMRRLQRCAQRGGDIVIVDEPLDTGETLATVAGALRRAGVDAARLVALLPVHPQRRDWSAQFAQPALASMRVVRLEPAEWYKHRLLDTGTVEATLRPYFLHRGYCQIKVIDSDVAAAFNAALERSSEPGFGSRLKRVYALRLAHADGRGETRYVLVKSVGWGWLGYHAFLAAAALAPFIAPVLGLREGMLYMEWLPQAAPTVDHRQIVRVVASYVSARARFLKLPEDPSPELSRCRQHDGIELLSGVLARACGSRLAAALHVPAIRQELARASRPVASLIDARMDPQEWISARGALLKTDFEHHGLGKSALNMTDPAYDLAGAIFGFRLSAGEERALIAQYLRNSGDAEIEQRLLLNKLLVGSAVMTAALARLCDPRLASRHAEANRSFIAAWHFQTAHAARYCGSLVTHRQPLRWRSPLVVLDLDGVLDTRRFGFPCTSAAGIRALSLLHAHGVALALDTARALDEVKEYCAAYGCAGAVAEYGSIVWDAVNGVERVLASAAAVAQLERLRGALRAIPGVYLDDSYRCAIRAYRFEGDAMVPLPDDVVSDLVQRLGADQIAVRHTTIDTALHARGTDKGTGLRALLELAALPEAETIAIGDSDADLPMFRVARRAYAPANISCREAAAAIGCHITRATCQRGLREAVLHLLHPNGGRCVRCDAVARERPAGGLFAKLLDFADCGRWTLLLRALADLPTLRALLASE